MARTWGIPGLLLMACIGGAEAQAPCPAFQRVRSADARMLAMLHEGCGRSATVKRLISRLELSDVTVYVEPGHCAFGHVDGCILPYMNRAGGTRYLRIAVNTSLSGLRLLAIIGHELQHAVEICEAPAVIDVESMRALFRRIGAQDCGQTNADCYETSQAQAAGRNVSDELKHKQ